MSTPGSSPQDRSQHGGLYKDAGLDWLRRKCNIAQFVSFDPHLGQRFSLIQGSQPNQVFPCVADGVQALITRSPERTVNVRSFHPESPQGRRFVYGLRKVDEVVDILGQLASAGLFTIVNETVDVNDGGVSGVAHGDSLEFAPGDTPRCVERPGTTRVSRTIGDHILETIYGFTPQIPFDDDTRVEFSIHPIRRGIREEHTLIWEAGELPPPAPASYPRWPTRLSKLIGDQAFGLVVAELLGLTVPATQVVPRLLPPFRLGQKTGSGETWIRTCPSEQAPGMFTTRRGWLDPFWLMEREDPEGTLIASVLAQEGVNAEYSGALLTLQSGAPVIEGVHGVGDLFMLGDVAPETLPEAVSESVRAIFERATDHLGPVRFEWVWDGRKVWIVQLHRERIGVSRDEIYHGHALRYRRFDARRGLAALRQEVMAAKREGSGIVLVGDVGLSSHMCDVLRKARLPSRLERTQAQPPEP